MAGKKKEPKARRKRPVQISIPGTEDAAIKEIEDAALDYADVRDQRQALTPIEVDKKARLLAVMHKWKKEKYHRGNITVNVTVEKEKAQVRIKKDKPDEESGGE